MSGSRSPKASAATTAACKELSAILEEFQETGLPILQGYQPATIDENAMSYILWASHNSDLETYFDWTTLSPSEQARQSMIRELISTETDYLNHLTAIVEVFIATAHALQDMGLLLDIDTSRLFTNIPDVLNASLYFFDSALFPMVNDAMERKVPFNTEMMGPGFYRFNDYLYPYEKYMVDQNKALDYLRSLQNHAEFKTYLVWCHSQKSCKRLQLSDIIAKPMQRLTKYSLIIQRISTHTELEEERRSLQVMDSFVRNFVTKVNRAIRQRDELEALEHFIYSLEGYEPEFKDDEMERCFRLHCNTNLRSPMPRCSSSYPRFVLHEADVRFKDNMKEFDARVILLTDMLLVCKKLSSKGNQPTYKLTRPKYFVEKLITYPKFARNGQDITALTCIMLDEVGTANYSFTLADLSKENNTMKTWELKIREAKLTYDYAVWLTKHPSRDVSEFEIDSGTEVPSTLPPAARLGTVAFPEDLLVDKLAKERIAVMLHRGYGVSTDYDLSQASMTLDSFDGDLMSLATNGGRGLRYPMKRNSTGESSRNSRLSSFQHSLSGDDPNSGAGRYLYRAGSSVEHVIPPLHPDDEGTSITVKVVSDSEEQVVTEQPVASPSKQLPMLVLQHSSPHKTLPSPLLPPRSPSAASSHNTLQVGPTVNALVHSLPDLSCANFNRVPRVPVRPMAVTASQSLYQSHNELLERNRLLAQQQQQHYLTPDHRGTSYPPVSPTRASLRRGLAFSYSFKNPRLKKVGHVESQQQDEAGPSTSTTPKRSGSAGPMPTTSGSVSPVPSTSGDKKKKLVGGRHKSSSVSPSGRKPGKEE